MDAAGYRSRVAEMRERARASCDLGVRDDYLALARQYDLLARRAQAEEKRRKDG